MGKPTLRAETNPPRLAPRPYQILSLTGGGYRGLFSATILAELEKRAGRPLHQVFDMIAGTSIGGILGIGLSCGVPAASLLAAFEQYGTAIFPRTYRVRNIHVFPRIRFGAFRGRYPSEGLARTVDAVLAYAPNCITLSDALTGLLVPSVDVLADRHVLFEHGSGDQTVRLRDIALATSAAPTYFPEHAIGNRLFIDGGLIANAPDIIALTRALAHGHPLDTIRIVSIGTAGDVGGRAARKPSSPGFVRGGARLFGLTLQAQQTLSVDLAAQMLGASHIRLDAIPSAEEADAAGLDKVGSRSTATLQNMAAETLETALSCHAAKLRDILGRTRA